MANAKKVEAKMGRREHPSKISIENFLAQCDVSGHGFSSYEEEVVFRNRKRPLVGAVSRVVDGLLVLFSHPSLYDLGGLFRVRTYGFVPRS